MNIQEPSTEDLQVVLAAHPHRFAEVVHLTVPGARGKPQRLTFVLGNPSGACRLPPGQKPSPAWSDVVSTTLRLKKSEGSEQIANDCVLFPDGAAFGQWCERWPALAESVWVAARRKLGGVLESIDIPDDTETMPASFEAAWEKHPNASARRYTPRDQKLLCLIDPPSYAPWHFFLDEIRKPDADPWKLSQQMASASVRACYDERAHADVAYEDVATRWPGVPLLTMLTVYMLAGAAADIELGNG
jgi:hypothetical protein